jgi:hypothetical protein
MIDYPIVMNALIATPLGVALAWCHLVLLRQHCRRLRLNANTSTSVAIRSLARVASLFLVFFLLGKHLESVQMLFMLGGFVLGRLVFVRRFSATVALR